MALRGPPMTVATEPYDVPPQDQLRLVKLPNILGVEPRPFDPDSFDAGAEVEIDARGLKRVRLRDLNCIRWVEPGVPAHGPDPPPTRRGVGSRGVRGLLHGLSMLPGPHTRRPVRRALPLCLLCTARLCCRPDGAGCPG